MILILSSTFDQSTNDVTDWLKLSVIRINRENHILGLTSFSIQKTLILLKICLIQYKLTLKKLQPIGIVEMILY